MTSENLNIVLSNAVCCSATKSLELSDLLSKGNLCTSSNIRELKILNDAINTLLCYKIDQVQNKFVLRLLYSNYIDFITNVTLPTKEYVLNVNGVDYSFIGDDLTTKYDAFMLLVDTAFGTGNYSTTIDIDTPIDGVDTYVYINIYCPCDTVNIDENTYLISTGALISSFSFLSTNSENCVPLNCLTEDEFNKLVSTLMSICDICECQLKK